jgi:hypothetical protein
MEKKQRRPGDPYEVGFGKPPKRTRFTKGSSGNPHGRPPKKPDLYLELTRVLRENVTITGDGQPEKVTVQQALLLRLRDQALRGEVWAEKLLQKVVEAMPESVSKYDHIEIQVGLFRGKALLRLMLEEPAHETSETAPDAVEAANAE